MANSIIPGCGVTHISLNASDFDRSVRFYTEGLGFTVFRKWGNPGRQIALLDSGDGTCIELFSDAKPGDVNGTLARRLCAPGVPCDGRRSGIRPRHRARRRVQNPAQARGHPVRPGAAGETGVCDRPDGEELEFFQVLA